MSYLVVHTKRKHAPSDTAIYPSEVSATLAVIKFAQEIWGDYGDADPRHAPVGRALAAFITECGCCCDVYELGRQVTLPVFRDMEEVTQGV
jgi:hypothetical protein